MHDKIFSAGGDRFLGLRSTAAVKRAAGGLGWAMVLFWTLFAAAMWWLVFPDGPGGGVSRPPLVPNEPGNAEAGLIVGLLDGLWMLLPYALSLLSVRAWARLMVARGRVARLAPRGLPREGDDMHAPGDLETAANLAAKAADHPPPIEREPWREGRYQSIRFTVVGYRLAMDTQAQQAGLPLSLDWVIKMANGARALIGETSGRFVWYRPLGRKPGLCTFEAWAEGHEVKHRNATYRVVRTWQSPPLWPLPANEDRKALTPADIDAPAEHWVLLEGADGHWLRICYAADAAPVIWEGEAAALESMELR